MSNSVKAAIGVATLFGMIGGGLYAFDGRYARAQDVDRQLKAQAEQTQQQMAEIKKLFIASERRGLESEKRALEREQSDLLIAQQKRKLSDLESTRLKAVTEAVGRLDAEIKSLMEREKESVKK